MNKKFFSGSNLSFYDSRDSEYIPSDSVEISTELYLAVLQGEGNGKQISVDDKGYPILIERPVVASDPRSERLWRNLELVLSDIELNKVQDGDKKARSTVSAWRNYRKELRDWPENENFPKEKFRPTSPQ